MNFRAPLAEFVGTFALCFGGIMSVITAATAGTGLLGVALAHGFIVAVFASATMHVSGGQINPAVTIALLVSGRMKAAAAGAYVAAQVLAAVLAALVLGALLPSDELSGAGWGLPALREGLPLMSGIVIEVILTFFLMYAILGTAVDKRAPRTAGLYIGLAVTLDILAGGPLTGAAMNPARWFSAAFGSGDYMNALVYTVGPILGAILAALMYGQTAEAEE